MQKIIHFRQYHVRLLKISRSLFFAACCLLLTTLPVPTQSAPRPSPAMITGVETYQKKQNEFVSAIVIDVASGKRLYAQNVDTPWPAASLTKLMTALVFLERKPRWGNVMTILRGDEVGGGRLRVKPGTRLSVRDLFYSSLVGSTNNTTMALVRTSGRSLKSFVRQMNAKARAFGFTKTVFVDPTGISPRNVSTAAELAQLGLIAFRNQVIRRAAAAPDYRIVLRNTRKQKLIHNTNYLLTRDPDMLVTGGKTGYLLEARHNLVVEMTAASEGNGQEPKLLVVVLGSPDKEHLFASAKALAQWAWKAYHWSS